jgi:transaldolase
MKLFVDSAVLEEIKTAASWGVVDGVTTNPTLIMKAGLDFKKTILEICKMVNGPISAETTDATAEGMIKQGREFAKWHKNVYVKVPCTIEGLKACQELTKLGIHVNVTLVFSANQILLAAKSGAALISPFVGRLVDAGEDGMQLIAEGVRIINAYGFKSQILVASIRNPGMVTEAAILGAHVATMPFAVLKQMYEHPLTDKGIEIFNKDWAKVENK